MASLIGAGGSLLGGIASDKGASSAAKTQAAAYQQGIAEQQREFNTTQQNLAPFLQTGTQALGAQAGLLGLNGNAAQGSAISALQSSPGFTALDQAGQDALMQNAAATGGLRGGNLETGLYNQRANLLASTIQQQLSNLGGLSGMGLGATGSLNTAGQNTANTVTNLLGAQGNANAYGAGAPYEAFSTALQNLSRQGGLTGNSAPSGGFTTDIGYQALADLNGIIPRAIGSF